jgi:queuine tRNA-ribosyltransferase
MAFAKTGRKSIKSAIFKEDFRPIDESCACYTCRNFSRAYLRHMFQVHEILPMELVSLHNLYFYSSLLRDARDAIVRDGYSRWKANILEGLKSENSI